MSNQTHYSAFISYRHTPRDIETAKHIQSKLEHFHIPASIRKEYGIDHFDRLFRDQEELEITDDLSAKITQALDNSDYLIVICSPAYNESKWCLLEIENFLKTHDRSHVLCVLSEGEPPAIFPKTLCEYQKTVLDENGKEALVDVSTEPLACDFRGDWKQADRIELPRLACALIGCGYDELVMRQEKYRRKRMAIILSCVLAASAIAISYLLYSNARISANYRQSLINESKLLSREALNDLEEANRYDALNSALKALENGRPETDDAVYALSKAVNAYLTPYQYKESWHIDASADVTDYFISKDGVYVVYRDSDSLFHCVSLRNREEKSVFSLYPDMTAFEEAGERKLIGYGNGCLVCADYLSGEILFEVPMKYQTIGISHMSPSGKYIGTADSFAVQITDKEGTPFLSLPIPDEFNGYLTDFCWSGDDAYLAIKLKDYDGNYSIGVFDFETSAYRQVSEGKKEILSYGFLSDDRLYVVDDDNEFVSNASANIYTRYENAYVFSVYDPWNKSFENTVSLSGILYSPHVIECGEDLCLTLADRVLVYDTEGTLKKEYSLEDSVIEVLSHTDSYLDLVTADGYRGTLWLEDGSSSMSRTFPKESEAIRVSPAIAMIDSTYVLKKNGNLHFYESVYDESLEVIGKYGFYYPPESSLCTEKWLAVKAENEVLVYSCENRQEESRITLPEGHAYHLLEIANDQIFILKIDALNSRLSVLSCSPQTGEISETPLPLSEPYIRNGYLAYPLSRAESIFLDSRYAGISSMCMVNHRLYFHDDTEDGHIVIFDLNTSELSEMKLNVKGYDLHNNYRAGEIAVSEDEKKLLAYGYRNGELCGLLYDLKSGDMTEIPGRISENRTAAVDDVIVCAVEAGLNVYDLNGNLLYFIGLDNCSAVTMKLHDGYLYCVCDDQILRIYQKEKLIRSVKLSFDEHSFQSAVMFRFCFSDDRLYLYDDDAMDVIHLGSDSSMPMYHVENSVLSFNEKENTLYVYSYDPQLRDLNYYVGVFDQYDTMTLIQTAEEILSRYKPQ